MDDFIRNMPKIELHAHLNGSLSTEVLLELGALKYGKTSEGFSELCRSFKSLGLSLSECFKKFKIAHDLTSTKEALQIATLHVIRDFSLDNVIYLEIRTTPKETPHMSKLDYLEACLEAIRSAKDKYPSIIVKLLPSIDRAHGAEAAQNTIIEVLKLLPVHSDVILGIDFSGDPMVGTFSDYKNVLGRVREANLKLAVHCGEIEGDEEVDEMLALGMDRCGHGTYIRGDHWKELLKRRIPVECCLSSNIKCGTVYSFDDHHFKTLWASGNPVIICTDDSGVFDTSLTAELNIAAKTFNLSKSDLYNLTKIAVDSSFASHDEKRSLHDRVKQFFDDKV